MARDARALLDKGEADPGELSAAAAEMGEGQYANLGVALKIHRRNQERHRGRTGGSPALPHDHPDWVALAAVEDQRRYSQLLADDELVRWIAGDPAEVAKTLRKFPDLAARFEAVA